MKALQPTPPCRTVGAGVLQLLGLRLSVVRPATRQTAPRREHLADMGSLRWSRRLLLSNKSTMWRESKDLTYLRKRKEGNRRSRFVGDAICVSARQQRR